MRLFRDRCHRTTGSFDLLLPFHDAFPRCGAWHHCHFAVVTNRVWCRAGFAGAAKARPDRALLRSASSRWSRSTRRRRRRPPAEVRLRASTKASPSFLPTRHRRCSRETFGAKTFAAADISQSGPSNAFAGTFRGSPPQPGTPRAPPAGGLAVVPLWPREVWMGERPYPAKACGLCSARPPWFRAVMARAGSATSPTGQISRVDATNCALQQHNGVLSWGDV